MLQQSPKLDPVHETFKEHFPSTLMAVVALSGRPVSFGGTGFVEVESPGVGSFALGAGSGVAKSSWALSLGKVLLGAVLLGAGSSGTGFVGEESTGVEGAGLLGIVSVGMTSSGSKSSRSQGPQRLFDLH